MGDGRSGERRKPVLARSVRSYVSSVRMLQHLLCRADSPWMMPRSLCSQQTHMQCRRFCVTTGSYAAT